MEKGKIGCHHQDSNRGLLLEASDDLTTVLLCSCHQSMLLARHSYVCCSAPDHTWLKATNVYDPPGTIAKDQCHRSHNIEIAVI